MNKPISKIATAKPVKPVKQQDPILKANIMLASACVFMAIAVVTLSTVAFTKPQTAIAIDDSGRIVLPYLLDVRNLTDSRVLEFADEAIRASFAHDFANYRRTLNYAKRFYTQPGGRMLQAEMDPLFAEMRKESVVMTSSPDVAVMVRSAFMYGGRIAWEVQIPLSIRYLGQKQNYSPRERLATLTIVQVPLDENIRGISVHTIQVAPYSKEQ